LRDYLDEFCSAYVDDILIYTSGTLEEHREHVGKVLDRLRKAGLQIDIDKCEFEVKSTKYLGFIIDAGRGLRMDPDKVKAIVEWEAPTSVKGVRHGGRRSWGRWVLSSDPCCAVVEVVKKMELK
jgi:hypothetical protein